MPLTRPGGPLRFRPESVHYGLPIVCSGVILSARHQLPRVAASPLQREHAMPNTRESRRLFMWRKTYTKRRDPPPGGWHQYLRDGWERGGWRQRYREYLLSGAWRQRREGSIHRAGGACQICQSPRRLQVHHVTYERIGIERADDVRVLCEACHGVRHTMRGAQPIPLDPATRHRAEMRAVAALAPQPIARPVVRRRPRADVAERCSLPLGDSQ